MNKEFKLPDVGEGLTEADIVSWHVKPGDTVTINQVIVEIETAKAVVELPSPYAGTVSALLVAEGQTVDVGIPIITIDVPVAGEAPAADAAPAGQAEAEAEPQPPAARSGTAPPARQPVLVGYGVKPGSTSRRPRKSAPTRPGSYPASPSAPVNGGPLPGTERPAQSDWPHRRQRRLPRPAPTVTRQALAKPPVRRLARDLGIELDRADGQRAGRVGHQGRCAEGSRRSNGTVRHLGLRRSQPPARTRSPSSARPQPGPLRSGSRCAGCASTPPPRWWRARSPRPM